MTTVYIAKRRYGNPKKYHTEPDCRSLNQDPTERDKDDLIGEWEKCQICEQGMDAFQSDTDHRRSLRRKLIAKGEIDE